MFKIIFIIIGTLIGAGFASGREIYLFFSKYGTNGIWGIFITGIITSVVIYKVLINIKTYEINTYNQLLERINWKHGKINSLLNKIVNLFLLVSFFIMVAGFGSYIKQTLNIPIIISSIVFVLICYYVFKKNIDGVIKVNGYLVPILVSLIIYIGIKNIPFIIKNSIFISKSNSQGLMWIVSSVLYASYNSIILIPVLTGLRQYLKNKKNIVLISILSGLMVTFLALLIYAMLLKEEYFIIQLEMPLMYIFEQFGDIFKILYGFIIIASIFTSAISTGYSFLKNVSNNQNMYNFLLIIMSILAVAISNIGFSKLVEILYPLFGILGLLQIILLLKNKNI